MAAARSETCENDQRLSSLNRTSKLMHTPLMHRWVVQLIGSPQLSQRHTSGAGRDAARQPAGSQPSSAKKF